jgi:hypothetical protein
LLKFARTGIGPYIKQVLVVKRWEASSCYPSLESNHHPVLRVEDDRTLRHHGLSFDQLHLEVVYDRSSRDLHVTEAEVLANAASGPGVEGQELVAGLVTEAATLGHPSLWLELQAVLAPYPFYPRHGVEREDDPCALGYLGAIW